MRLIASMRTPRSLFLLTTLLTPLAGFASSLEEIVISASQSASTKQQAVSQMALSDIWLSDLYIDSYENLASFVPGLFIQEQSINSAGFAIRGMTSDNIEATRTPRVSVWLHNMDISRTQGAYVAMYDLERVDVFKGPATSFFARGGQIGGVNIINRFAQTETDAAISMQLGSFNEIKATGHGNLAMGDQAVRLALYSHQRDGYIKNSDGNDLGSVDTLAARLSFLLNFNDLRVDIQVNYEENSPTGTPFQSLDYPVDKPWQRADLNDSHELGIDRTIKDIYARAQLPVGEQNQLQWAMLYRDVATYDTFDPDGTRLDLIRAQEDAQYTTFETNLVLDYNNQYGYGHIGLAYFHEEAGVLLAARINERLAIRLPLIQQTPELAGFINTDDIDNELFTPSGEPNPYLDLDLTTRRHEQQRKSVDNESLSLFWDNSLPLASHTDLHLGLRYSFERLRTLVVTPEYDDGGENTVAAMNLFLRPAENEGPSSYASKDVSGVSGRIGISHYLANNHSLYATYARGRRPDILNFTEQSEREDLRAETVDSYEVGARWQLPDGYSHINTALYYYDFRHFATQRSGVTAGVVESDDNASATVHGAEIDWMQFFANGYLLFANLSYNDAIFDESDIITGKNRFRYAPLWSGSLSLSRDWLLNHNWQLRLAGQATFQSTVYFEDDNTANDGRSRQSGYPLYNLFSDISYRENLTIKLFINNLTDKNYMVDSGNFGQMFGMPTFVPAIGRHYGAGFSYRF